MTSYTPGPWRYGTDGRSTGFPADVYGPDHQPIAVMHREAGNGTYGAERDSNARLITEAPAMRDLLHIILMQHRTDGAYSSRGEVALSPAMECHIEHLLTKIDQL